MSSMVEVARRAGVSTATVSRVLTNKPHVREEVRARVMKAVEELGYRRNSIARNLRMQRSSIIGLLVSDIRNSFFTDVARAIEDIALDNGFSVFLCNTDENPDKEAMYLENLIQERAAGIILSPTSESGADFRQILDSDIPAVTIDRLIAGSSIDAVVSNNYQSGYMLTVHLIEQGYKSIGAIIGLQNSTTGRERMRGVRQALQDSNLPVNESHFAYVHPREKEGRAEMDRIFAEGDVPEAMITGNSRLTIGVIEAIKAAGLRIPEDVGIAGFDETNWTPFVEGGITVVSQPTYEMGHMAAELLIDRINEEKRASREVILKGQLIARRSTQR